MIWPPVGGALEERLRAGDRLTLIIAPFVKVDALRRLDDCGDGLRGSSIVARWREADLIAGVSDAEAFPFIRDRGGALYVHREIHLKLFVFESGSALSTSANVTGRGLGFVSPGNIEAGNWVDLGMTDWERIYALLEESRRVGETELQKALDYVQLNSRPQSPLPALDLFMASKEMTIAALPAVSSPNRLIDLCLGAARAESPEEARMKIHDVVLYHLEACVTREQLLEQIADRFKNSPFVSAFVAFLRSRGQLRFGEANDWIYHNCEDVPLPYRWEIKSNTRVLYDWLAYFFQEIAWHRPRHSQVISWRN